jgi:hydroxymethylbilane synthase
VAARAFVAGTRGSRLALRQTEIVLEALRRARAGVKVDVREIHTEGDRKQDISLMAIGGQGVFVKALEDALLAGEIDFAVHSLKDVPAQTAGGLAIVCVPQRDDPRDALVARGGVRLEDLPPGARIGTSSQRREVQLRALRDDIECADIRGNVDTRIRKVDEGLYDGAVLAVAGLKRLGLLDRASEVFDAAGFLPAVGQGSLAVEARGDDRGVIEMLTAIDDADAHIASVAERAFLGRLGGGCRLPFGALAEAIDDSLRVRAFIGDSGGHEIIRAEAAGPRDEAEGLGVGLAESLLAQGGREFMELPA